MLLNHPDLSARSTIHYTRQLMVCESFCGPERTYYENFGTRPSAFANETVDARGAGLVRRRRFTNGLICGTTTQEGTGRPRCKEIPMIQVLSFILARFSAPLAHQLN